VAQKQRKTHAKQSGSGLRAFYITLAVIALAGVGWIGYSLTNRGGGPVISARPLTGLDNPKDLLEAAKGIVLGEANAPVQVLVFSDFTCPACRQFQTNVEPLLKSELVATGKVHYTYYDYVLDLQASGAHRYGFIAARAARCANDQGKFWEMHDAIFARQQEWSFEGSPPIQRFVDYATGVGIEPQAFRTCLSSDQHADVVTANRMLGDNLGVSGTPTVYVAGRVMPQWNNYEELKKAVEGALGAR
jgi:protein-disulfide isomerase